MKNTYSIVAAIFMLVANFSWAQDQVAEKATNKKKTLNATKPTGAMKACDQRLNRAAVGKTLSQVSLKNFESEFTLKSAVYYPAEADDEIFDVKVTAGQQEFDVAITMDEKCKKVLKVSVEKLD